MPVQIFMNRIWVAYPNYDEEWKERKGSVKNDDQI
jgi:hypothetical protein